MDIKTQINKKVIAIVYVFENEYAEGYGHFYAWSASNIAIWLNAIEFLGCVPYIIDTRTFLKQASENNLPHIDFVLNMNNGNTNLDAMSLVTSVCSFLNIPCIPSNSTATIVGENKKLSNQIAKSLGINVPADAIDMQNAIYRPNNLGNSSGVIYGDISSLGTGIKQEFIKGYDITTPVLFDPSRKELSVLPSIIYYNKSKSVDWFLDETSKENRDGYKKSIIKINKHTENLFIKLANYLGVGSYCRIDSRVKCNSPDKLEIILKNGAENDDIFFIEVNSLPTMKNNTAFLNSLNYCQNMQIQNAINEFVTSYKVFNDIAFVLYCSISKFL